MASLTRFVSQVKSLPYMALHSESREASASDELKSESKISFLYSTVRVNKPFWRVSKSPRRRKEAPGFSHATHSLGTGRMRMRRETFYCSTFIPLKPFREQCGQI